MVKSGGNRFRRDKIISLHRNTTGDHLGLAARQGWETGSARIPKGLDTVTDNRSTERHGDGRAGTVHPQNSWGDAAGEARLPPLPKYQSLLPHREVEDAAGWTTGLTQRAQ